MTTVTQVTLACDVCGNPKDVKTWTFRLDGQGYEIDLCRKDGTALAGITDRYIAKARKVTGPGRRRHDGRPRSRAAKAGHAQPRNAKGAPTPAAQAAGSARQKGICVYGILPAEIEVAADVPGIGEHPGPLRDVRLDGLAALISEVDLSGPLGSPDDLRTYREILDATAAEVPILPLPFGTVLTSEDAVAGELLAAHHDEFAAALDQLEGRAEFQVKGRYVEDADPVNEAAAARREEDTRALRHAMAGVCVASVASEPAHELDAVHVAFLVAVDQEREVERVVEDLARQWEGRVELELLGPMAAYDFTRTAQEQSRAAGLAGPGAAEHDQA